MSPEMVEGIVATRLDELTLAKCQHCGADVIAPPPQRAQGPVMAPICRPCVRELTLAHTVVAIAPLYDDGPAPGRTVVEE